MEGVRCPRIIGRVAELDVLRAGVGDAVRGRGGVYFVLGEAGVGKSRLATDVAVRAEEAGLLVLRGRAVDSPHPVTFRPLSEALLAALRNGELPGDDALDGFGPALGRLLPGRDSVSGDVSLLAVAEGMLRLLRLVGRSRGCLLVLEDLHWADPETLAVLEYLADHVAGERLACLATMRIEPPGPAVTLASALDARGAARRVSVRRLSDADVHRMMRACLETDTVPSDVDTFVAGRADGLPFFVEELLAGLVSSGALVRDPGGWRAMSRLVPAVPLTVTASIRQRLTDPAVRDVLSAAAVLGRRFDWALLAEITGRPESEVLAALRAGTDNQLLDGSSAEVRFRHALTRDAVLNTVLPPERARLSASAAVALQARYPKLDEDRCELAASLHEAAGDDQRAGELLLLAADRATRRGALSSAEALLTRAGELGAAASIPLLHVLALSGQTTRVFELGDALSTQDIPEVQLALARAAISAGSWERAGRHLARVPGSAQATVLAAQVAMGEGRLPDAAELARAALAGADGLPEVACEALEILGRVVRAGDLAAAEELFTKALHVAERAGLAVWRLRALHELGTIDLLDTGRLDRLEAARAAAVECGALATLAVIDLHLGDMLSVSGRGADAIVATTRCLELSRRLGLSTLPAALGHLATHQAIVGNIDVAEGLLAELREIAPDLPDVPVAMALVRAMHAVLRVEDQTAREQLGLAAAAVAEHPTIPFPHRALWALLCTVHDAGGDAARETVRNSGALAIRAVGGFLPYADAVALGRLGRVAEAEAAFAEAEEMLSHYLQPDLMRSPARRLVAEAALRDGWGDPVEWLRLALPWFEEQGYELSAAHFRNLLKEAGAPVRRKRVHGEVPQALRELGVTGREWEVLALVAEGLSNAEIGERLFISPRTVEKHVEKLLTRTGTRTRGQLAVKAERLRMG